MIPQDVADEIYAASAKFNVDPALVFAIAENESGFDQSAVSHDKHGNPIAYGVMQLVPSTAEGLGYSKTQTDLHQNVEAGVKYIAQLQGQFGNDTRLVAAAYNAGPQAVVDNGGVPPYAETQAYVPRVVASYQKFKGQVKGFISDHGFVIGDQLPGYNQVVWPGKTYQTPINLNPFDPAYWGGENNFGNVGIDANGNVVINNKTPDAVSPIVDRGSDQEKAFAKVDAAAKNANKPDGWQGFISDTVHGIETNLLLGGIALGLLAGGFALIASDHPGAVRKAAVAAAPK